MGTGPDSTKSNRRAKGHATPRPARAKKPEGQAVSGGTSTGSHEAILRAAEQEFAIAGYGGARADRIAAKAGVNRALPFYYFGSKANLYDQVMARAFRRLSDLSLHVMGTAAHLPPAERLRVFVRSLLSLTATDSNWMRLIVREIIDDGTRARDFARTHLAPVAEIARHNMQREFQAAGITDIDSMQILVSVTCEAFFYFIFMPALEGMGLAEPFSRENLGAREEAIVAMIARCLKGSATI